MSRDGRASPPGSHVPPYYGNRRKLVVAFDVGTTFSGISYCVLDPGQVPIIKGVIQFPGQVASSGACKVPTVIYYDQQGKVRAVGAEATKDGMYDLSQEENWTKAEWFKLHLRSKFGTSTNLLEEIPCLPPNKTVVAVISDFLAYLLECTATFIQDTDPNGQTLWQDFLSGTWTPSDASNDGIHFVLSHPNGWEGKEQAQMREAAVKARLIPDTPEGQERIKFVTEGEASLHFAVHNGLLSHIDQNEGIVVVDAGGGTVDVSTYKREKGQRAQAFEEIAEARCYFHGSVFVTVAAKNFLKDKLSESDFLDDLEDIASCFDQTTKLRFSDDRDPQYIKFGGRKDNDANVGIRFGQMKLEGSEVAKFYEASIDCVVQAVLEQKKRKPQIIRHVILVGGFSASDYLFHKVRAILIAKGMSVVRPENNVVKAVSDGAISFFVDQHIYTRMTKVAYGTDMLVNFDPSKLDHQARASQSFTDKEGKVVLEGSFGIIIPKGTQIKEDKEFKREIVYNTFKWKNMKAHPIEILCYRGQNPNPIWVDADSDNFSPVCRLVADLSRVPRTPQINPSGKMYYSAEYDIVMLFGLTELKAQIKWMENGVEKRSPANLIYD